MRILWIGKQPSNSQGGDEIYDRKAIQACRALGHTVDLFHPQRVSRLKEVQNFLKGLPYYRARYSSVTNLEGARAALAEHDAVICSWEPLDFFATQLGPPVIIILHNITSQSLRAIFPGNPIAFLAARRVRRWERQHYRASVVSAIALLSRRDEAYIKALDDPPIVLFAPPGMPPASSLDADATLSRELVISGTYDWHPKKRDVIKFAREYAIVDEPLKIRGDSLPAAAFADLILLPLPTDSEARSAIRFGIITDRFESGHKLKTLSYIANNQIVLSFSDVSVDFEQIPDNDLFIRRVRSVKEIEAHVASLEAMPLDDLRYRFLRFKHRCETDFTWDAVGASLMQTAARLLTAGSTKRTVGKQHDIAAPRSVVGAIL
jgi:hypothetical protein